MLGVTHHPMLSLGLLKMKMATSILVLLKRAESYNTIRIVKHGAAL